SSGLSDSTAVVGTVVYNRGANVTPPRAAPGAAVPEQRAAQRGRRGVSTAAAPRPTAGRSPDEAYRALHDAIVCGRLQPNERLVEADLGEALGVGRAAIRTALVRLEQEGLVERERNRGARVRLISLPR